MEHQAGVSISASQEKTTPNLPSQDHHHHHNHHDHDHHDFPAPDPSTDPAQQLNVNAALQPPFFPSYGSFKPEQSDEEDQIDYHQTPLSDKMPLIVMAAVMLAIIMCITVVAVGPKGLGADERDFGGF